MKVKNTYGGEMDIDPQDYWLYAPMEAIEATAEVGGINPKTGELVFVPLSGAPPRYRA